MFQYGTGLVQALFTKMVPYLMHWIVLSFEELHSATDEWLLYLILDLQNKLFIVNGNIVN